MLAASTIIGTDSLEHQHCRYHHNAVQQQHFPKETGGSWEANRTLDRDTLRSASDWLTEG
jgi:hypothetical protein